MNMKKMNVTNRMYEAGALAIVRAETLDRGLHEGRRTCHGNELYVK